MNKSKDVDATPLHGVVRRRFIGNCPECGSDCNSATKYTPRHGHVKWGGRWLPACKGTGKELENIQEIKHRT